MGKQPELVLPGSTPTRTAPPTRSKMRLAAAVGLLLLIAHASSQLLWPVNQLPFRLAGNATVLGGAGVQWTEKRVPRIAVVGAGAGGASSPSPPRIIASRAR